MPKAEASNTTVHAVASSSTQVGPRRPVLDEGEEEDIEDIERMYEEKYDGDVPKVLVGLEFQRAPVKWYSEHAQEAISIPFWQFVLRNLASKLLGDDYVMTSRELLQLEIAEAANKKQKDEWSRSSYTQQLIGWNVDDDNVDLYFHRLAFCTENERESLYYWHTIRVV